MATDDTIVSSDISHSMNQLIDHLVEQVPGVLGALVSSADGFTLVARIPDRPGVDAAALGAMSAAALALSHRLVQTVGDDPATVSHHRSADAQAFVFAVANLAVLTVLTDHDANVERIAMVGREVSSGLQRLFRGAATVWPPPSERNAPVPGT